MWILKKRGLLARGEAGINEEKEYQGDSKREKEGEE